MKKFSLKNIVWSIFALAFGSIFLSFGVSRFTSFLKQNPHDVIAKPQVTLKQTMNASADNNSSNKNPTSISQDQIKKPENYPNWVQYYGPWADLFGGTAGSKNGTDKWGPTNTNNVGCVATAIAIQMARGGVKKAANGEDFNPGSNQKSNGCTQNYNPQTQSGNGPNGLTSYKTGDKGTVTRDPKIGDSNGDGAFGDDNHKISDKDALAQCKKIADAGDYPLLRVNGDQHTVAFWKAGDGKPLYYDPARNYQGATVKSINYVGAMKKGQLGAFDYNSPAPNGGSGSSSNSNDSSSSGQQQSSNSSNQNAQTGGADIKPVFNPFRTPVLKEKTADNINGENQASRAETLQAADGIGPFVLSVIREFMIVMIYVYVMLITLGSLIKISDYFLGGVITDAIQNHTTTDSLAQKLFLPNGEILGIGGYQPREIVLNALGRFLPIFIVLLLIASGTFSRIIAWVLTGITHLAPHTFNF